jgi:hypothetical protein
MYYLKIGKLWVSEVKPNSYQSTEHMLYGWSNEEDAVEAAKIVAGISDRDVLLLKLEVIRSIEAD